MAIEGTYGTGMIPMVRIEGRGVNTVISSSNFPQLNGTFNFNGARIFISMSSFTIQLSNGMTLFGSGGFLFVTINVTQANANSLITGMFFHVSL